MPRTFAQKKDWSNWVIAWATIITLGLTVLGLVGAKIYESFSFKETLATKAYVDVHMEEIKHYVDDRTSVTLDKSYSHSDANHSDMVSRVEILNSDLKTSKATFETKLDVLISEVRRLSDLAWDAGHKRKGDKVF